MQTQHLTDLPKFKRFSGTMDATYASLFDTETIREEEATPIEINGNVLFIADYLQKEKEKTAIITELKDILENLSEWEEEGVTLSESSIKHAISFANTSIIANNLSNPHIEFHPDGEIAFTWKKAAQGIMNIAFNEEGIATWAAYLDGDQKRTIKGRFRVESTISEIEKSIIQAITR